MPVGRPNDEVVLLESREDPVSGALAKSQVLGDLGHSPLRMIGGKAAEQFQRLGNRLHSLLRLRRIHCRGHSTSHLQVMIQLNSSGRTAWNGLGHVPPGEEL